MKGFMARAVIGVVLVVLGLGAAWGRTPDPEAAPEPAPAPAPAAADDGEKGILELKTTVIELRLTAAKALQAAKGTENEREIRIVLQLIDSLYSKLEDKLQNG